ncbi:unnamed protein product [Lactuca saligna]|uniref:Uncharacterized protein n=1 Tax=Lactuca saligna TaxID=75948 RepID=A0AA35Y282_LACSI|nr:unnamed protein product [Lactuca saligna]
MLGERHSRPIEDRAVDMEGTVTDNLQDSMGAIGMMMVVVAMWGAQELYGYRSAGDECCGCAALERPISNPVQPTATLVGPNAILASYGSPENQK